MLVYYSTRIFANIGLSDYLSQLLAAVMNTGFAIGTYPLPYTIEKFGRRPIMMWSALVCATSMLIFVVMIGLPSPTIATQWTAVAFVIVYNFAFGYGWVGCPWLYGPEVCVVSAEGRAGTNASSDCASQIPTYWGRCRVNGRMAFLVHHRICWRYCHRKNRMEDLDLATCCLHFNHPIRLFHVSRGMFLPLV